MRGIETDYLVVGAGAAGMAFVDSLIDACHADVVMVDRRHRPGGHWNDAYPFVRLRGVAGHRRGRAAFVTPGRARRAP
jgi:cation diffusion facilitator CzcD-associated flavoprotein CzcO